MVRLRTSEKKITSSLQFSSKLSHILFTFLNILLPLLTIVLPPTFSPLISRSLTSHSSFLLLFLSPHSLYESTTILVLRLGDASFATHITVAHKKYTP